MYVVSPIIPKNFFAVVKALVQTYGTQSTTDAKHQYNEAEKELQLVCVSIRASNFVSEICLNRSDLDSVNRKLHFELLSVILLIRH